MGAPRLAGSTTCRCRPRPRWPRGRTWRELVRVDGELLGSSPSAEDLDRDVRRLARPAAFSASSVDLGARVEARARGRSRLTACVCVRNGSNGIDFFMCGPRSLRIRMWIGIWPPSKRGAVLGAGARAVALLAAAGGLARARALAAADALAGLAASPAAGLSVCRPTSRLARLVFSAIALALLDLDRGGARDGASRESARCP